MGTDTVRALFERSVALAAQIHMYTAAHAASRTLLPTAQARAVGGDARRRAPFEQGGLECRLQPAPRLATPDRSHAWRMPAHPIPAPLHAASGRMDQPPSCLTKIWPIWSSASNLV